MLSTTFIYIYNSNILNNSFVKLKVFNIQLNAFLLFQNYKKNFKLGITKTSKILKIKSSYHELIKNNNIDHNKLNNARQAVGTQQLARLKILLS